MRPVNLIPPEERQRRPQADARRPPRLHRRRRPTGSAGRRHPAGRSPTTRSPTARRKWPNSKTETATAEARANAPRALHPIPRRPQRARADRGQPCRQPLRLGAGDAPARPGPSRRRLADQPHRHGAPGRLGRQRRKRLAAQFDPRPRALDWSAAPPDRKPLPASSPCSRTSMASPASACSPRSCPGGSGGGESARSRPVAPARSAALIAQFQIVVAFDAAPIPAAATGDDRSGRRHRLRRKPAPKPSAKRAPRPPRKVNDDVVLRDLEQDDRREC